MTMGLWGRWIPGRSSRDKLAGQLVNVILVGSFVILSCTGQLYPLTLLNYLHLHPPRTPTADHNTHIIRISCFTNLTLLPHYSRVLDDDFLPYAAPPLPLPCSNIISSYHCTCSLVYHA